MADLNQNQSLIPILAADTKVKNKERLQNWYTFKLQIDVKFSLGLHTIQILKYPTKYSTGSISLEEVVSMSAHLVRWFWVV